MFIAYEVSIQLITSLRGPVALIERSDRDLADQLRRSATFPFPFAAPVPLPLPLPVSV